MRRYFLVGLLVVTPILSLTASSSQADIVVKSNGEVVNGKVVEMKEGKLAVQTSQGINQVELEGIKGFSIEEAKEEGVSEQVVNQLMSMQEQILQRLDLLTQSLANLERQLLNVQTNQQVNADRLSQRTREVNPLGRLIVAGYQINRVGGKTVVTGQVVNQSETPLSNVQVDVYVFGSTGKLASEGGQKKETVFVQPPALAPGQAAVFTASFRDGYQVDNVNFDVRGLPPYGYSVNPPTGRAATGDF